MHQEDGAIDALVVMLKVEGVALCRALTLSKVCGAMYHLHVAACQMQVRIYVINVVPSIVVCGTGWRIVVCGTGWRTASRCLMQGSSLRGPSVLVLCFVRDRFQGLSFCHVWAEQYVSWHAQRALRAQ